MSSKKPDGAEAAETNVPTIVVIPEDILAMTYQEARDELVSVVARLEAGGTALEDSLALWERGETLAAHCQRWLDAADPAVDPAD
jgi:exodeoxyribonuclease VII small subunit